MSGEGGGRASRATRALPAALIAAVLAFAAIVAPSGASNNLGVHWSDGNDNMAHVTLVDGTGPAWPVFAAAIEWDNAGRINVIYRSNGCGGNGHCVNVNAEEFQSGCHNLPAETIIVTQGGGSNHLDGDTRVRLNNKCKNDADHGQHSTQDLRVLTCHEEGHVLGLAHELDSSFANDTCMYVIPGQQFQQGEETPRQHDFVMLDDNIYDHND